MWINPVSGISEPAENINKDRTKVELISQDPKHVQLILVAPL